MVADAINRATDDVLSSLSSIHVPPTQQSTLQKLAGFYIACLGEQHNEENLTVVIAYTLNYYNITWIKLLNAVKDSATMLDLMIHMTMM